MSDTDRPVRTSRRAFLRGLGLTGGALLASAAIAACGGTTAAPSGDAGAASTTTSSQAAAPTAAPSADSSQTVAPAATGSALQLQLWTFADTHARWFKAMAADYTKQNPNIDVAVTLIAYNDLHDKLQVALQSGGAGAPDLSDIEQGRFGGFLRSDDPGLVDLTDRLQSYQDKLVAARQALYTYKGKTYGIEHALTPVVLYYRADVWEAAGADPAKFATWDDYIAGAKKVSKGDVKAIPLPPHEVLLRQRGGDYFDKDGNVTIDSDLSIKTMDWILNMKTGDGIAAQATGVDQNADDYFPAVIAGKFLSMVGADWYGGFIKDHVPDQKGKWKATQLPAFDANGLHTSCAGGTGNCIIKTSKNADEAWKFQQFTMLSPDANVRRFQLTTLFPPLKPAWEDARLHQPDAYFSGQDLGKLFASVGPNVPAQYQSPFRSELNTKLTPMWQDIYDGKVKPADAFKQVADDIRSEMKTS